MPGGMLHNHENHRLHHLPHGGPPQRAAKKGNMAKVMARKAKARERRGKQANHTTLPRAKRRKEKGRAMDYQEKGPGPTTKPTKARRKAKAKRVLGKGGDHRIPKAPLQKVAERKGSPGEPHARGIKGFLAPFVGRYPLHNFADFEPYRLV